MDQILDFLYSLHFNPTVFAIQLTLFTCFHFLMKVLIYTPLATARNAREGTISGQLATAEASAANARALKLRHEEEIRAQRLTLAQQLKEATEEAEKRAAEMMQKARAEAERVTDEATAKLNEEQTQLLAAMDHEADRLARAVARQVVRNSLTEDAQGRVLAQLKG